MIDILIFIMENRTMFFAFLLNRPNIRKKQSQNEHLSQFSDKSDEIVREKTYLLKLEFYNTDRKMKSTIRCIFISIITNPNFMHFRPKNKLKKCVRNFYSSQWAFENSLNFYGTKNQVVFGIQVRQ